MNINYVFIVSLIFCLTLEQCTPVKKESKIVNIETKAFPDKSASTLLSDPQYMAKAEKLLINCVLQNLVNRGDKVTYHFIYGNTLNKNNSYEHSYNPPLLNLEGLSDAEQETEQIKYKTKLQNYKQLFAKGIVSEMLDVKNTSLSTDVFGVFRWLYLSSINKRDNSLEAIIFSDLVETSAPFFSKNEIADFYTAKSKATEHAPKIVKMLDIPQNCLNKVNKIRVILPSEKILNESKDVTYLPEFFSMLCKELGYKNEVEFL